MDYTVHGILQARILEWVAFPFSKGSSQGPWKMFYWATSCLISENISKPESTSPPTSCLSLPTSIGYRLPCLPLHPKKAALATVCWHLLAQGTGGPLHHLHQGLASYRLQAVSSLPPAFVWPMKIVFTLWHGWPKPWQEEYNFVTCENDIKLKWGPLWRVRWCVPGTRSLTDILPVSAFRLQQRSWAVRSDAFWPAKPEIFTLSPSAENVC